MRLVKQTIPLPLATFIVAFYYFNFRFLDLGTFLRGSNTLNETSRSFFEPIIGCTTPACIQQLGSHLHKFYSNRTNKEWCEPNKKGQPKPQNGITLIKVPKSSSSTAAGVIIRIGRRNKCGIVRWKHKIAYSYSPIIRRRKSLVVTSLRDPGARAMSIIDG